MRWLYRQLYRHYERLMDDYEYRIKMRIIAMAAMILIAYFLPKILSYNHIIYDARIVQINKEKTYVVIINKDEQYEDIVTNDVIVVDRLVTDYIGKKVKIGYVKDIVDREGFEIVLPELIIILLYEFIRLIIDFILLHKERNFINSK